MIPVFMCGCACSGKTHLSTLWEQSDLTVRTLHVGEAMRSAVGEAGLLRLERPLAPEELDPVINRLVHDFMVRCRADGVNFPVVDSMKVPRQVRWLGEYGGVLVRVTASPEAVHARICGRLGESQYLARMVCEDSLENSAECAADARRLGHRVVTVDNEGSAEPWQDVLGRLIGSIRRA